MSINYTKLFTVLMMVLFSSLQLQAQLSEKALKELYKKEFMPLFKGDKSDFEKKAMDEVRTVYNFGMYEGVGESELSGESLVYFLENQITDETRTVMKNARLDQIHEIESDKSVTAVAYISEPYTRGAENEFGKEKVITSFVLEKTGKEWKLAEFASYPIYGDQDYRENIMKSLATVYNGSPLQAEAEKFLKWMKTKDVESIFDYPSSRFVFGGETWRGTSILLVEQFDERNFFEEDGYNVPKKYNDMNNKQCLEALMDHLMQDIKDGNYKIKAETQRYNGRGVERSDSEYLGFWEGSMDSKLTLVIYHGFNREGQDMKQELTIGFSENEDGPFMTYVRQKTTADYGEEDELEALMRELENMAEESAEEEELTEEAYEEEMIEEAYEEEMIEEEEEYTFDKIVPVEELEEVEEYHEEEAWFEEEWDGAMSDGPAFLPTGHVTIRTLVDDPYGLILQTIHLNFIQDTDNKWMIDEINKSGDWYHEEMYLEDEYGSEGYGYEWEEATAEAREEIWEQCIRPILSKDKDRIIQISDFPIFVDESYDPYKYERLEEFEETTKAISDADEFVDWLNNTLTKELREILEDKDHKKISFQYYRDDMY